MADNGRDYFKASIDTSQFNKDAASIRNTFRGIGDTAEKEGARIDTTLRNIGRTAIGVFGGIQISRFVKDIVRVRSEFQNTEAMFKVFLGSAEKASVFMKEMQSYAFHNVFEFKDLTQQAAQLLAYGTEVEHVTEVIDKLSNVAAGVNKPLERFVELYTKAKSNDRITTQEIQQWGVLGDVVSYLSDMLGKSKTEIRTLISEGKIGFKEMDKLLTKLTASGGKFSGVMEEKMKTLGDSVGLLEDTITSVLNEMGEKSQGLLRGGILLANELVENYETLGEVLIGLIATYGTYKASLVVIAALERANMQVLRQAVIEKNVAAVANIQLSKSEAIQIATKKLLTAHTISFTAALKAQTLAMMTNPAVLLTTALVGLGFAIYKVATFTTELGAAQKRLREVQGEVTEATVKEERELTSYDRKLSETTKGTQEYKKIKDEIIEKYSAYHSGLDAEIKRVGNLSSLYEDLSANIKKTIAERKLEAFEIQEQQHLDKVIGEHLDKAYHKLQQLFGKEKGLELYKSFYDAAMRGSDISDEHKKAFNKTGFWDVTLTSANSLLYQIEKEKEASKQVVEDFKEIYQIKNIESKEGDDVVDYIATLAEQTEEVRHTISKLREELDALRKGKTPTNDYAKEIEEKAKELKNAESKLNILLYGKSTLDKDDSESIAKLKLNARKRIDDADKERQIEKLAFDIQIRQREIDNMDDSFQKSLAQLKLNLDKELQAIEEYKNRIADSQYEEIRNQYIEARGTDKGFEEYVNKLSTEQITAILPEDLQPENINKQVAILTEAANQARQTGLQNVNKEIAELLNNQNLVFASNLEKELADIDAHYSKLLIEAEGFESEKTLIHETHQKLRQEASLKDQYNEIDFAEQLETERLGGLESIGMTELVEEKKLEIAKKYTEQRIEVLKQLADLGGEDAKKQLAILQVSLKKMDIQKPAKSLKSFADKSVFNLIVKGFKNVGDSADEAEEKTVNLLGSFSKNAGTVADTVQQMKSMFGGLDESLDMVLDTVGNIAQGFAQGGMVGGAMAIISEGINLMGKASEAEKRHQEALKAIAQSKLDLQRQYNLLLLEQNLLFKEASTIFGEEQILKAINTIDTYRAAVVKFNDAIKGSAPDPHKYFMGSLNPKYKEELNAYRKGIAGLHNQQIVTGHKKSGLFGWGKGKDVYSSLLKIYKYDELIDKEGKLNAERVKSIINNHKMSDSTKSYLQNLLNLDEFAEKALESLRDYLQETFGALGPGAVNAIVDSIKNGTDAWVEFGKVGASVLEKLGEQLAYELFFSKKFEKLQKDLEKVYGSNRDPKIIARESMNLVGNFYQNIGTEMNQAKEWMQTWKEQAKRHNFDLWKSEDSSFSQTPSKGYSVSLTQDTGDHILGRVTGIYEVDLKTENLLEKLALDIKEMYLLETDNNRHIKNMGMSFEEIRNIQLQSMYHLEDISKYTKVLPQMSKNIKQIMENTA